MIGKGPFNLIEIFYFVERTIGVVQIDDYKYRFINLPNCWFSGTVKVD
jgi:hypothetical protein